MIRTYVTMFIVLFVCFIAIAVSAQSIPVWQPNTAYAVGALVTFNGQEFRCIQAHTSQQRIAQRGDGEFQSILRQRFGFFNAESIDL